MAKMVYESENIKALANKIRELAGTNTQYTTYDLADGAQDVYNAGYAKGYAEGQKQGGGGGDDYGVGEMLTTLPFLRNIEVNTIEYGSILCPSGFIVGMCNYETTLYVIPPWVGEVQECAFDNLATWEMQPLYAIFLPKTPPAVGWQGMWSEQGGNLPPAAIFVPDESLEAYKNTTNLAEYAESMKPLSEYNGEGYFGGSM